MLRKYNKSSLVAVIALVSLAALAPSCSSSSGDDDNTPSGGSAGHAGAGAGGASAGTNGVGGATAGSGGATAGSGGASAGSGGATAGSGGATAGSGGATGGTGGGTIGAAGSAEGGDTGETTGGTTGITGATGSYTFDTPGNIQGWQSFSDSVNGVPRTPAPVLSQSTEQFFEGTGSLKIDVSGWTDTFQGEAGAPATAENAQATVQLNLPAIIPGKTVTFHVFITTTTGLNYAQTFIQAKADYSSFVSYPITLVAGWNTVHLLIPLDNPLPIVNIGLQFGLKSDYSAPIYLDSISW
jgi:hypothetical protein